MDRNGHGGGALKAKNFQELDRNDEEILAENTGMRGRQEPEQQQEQLPAQQREHEEQATQAELAQDRMQVDMAQDQLCQSTTERLKLALDDLKFPGDEPAHRAHPQRQAPRDPLPAPLPAAALHHQGAQQQQQKQQKHKQHRARTPADGKGRKGSHKGKGKGKKGIQTKSTGPMLSPQDYLRELERRKGGGMMKEMEQGPMKRTHDALMKGQGKGKGKDTMKGMKGPMMKGGIRAGMDMRKGKVIGGGAMMKGMQSPMMKGGCMAKGGMQPIGGAALMARPARNLNTT